MEKNKKDDSDYSAGEIIAIPIFVLVCIGGYYFISNLKSNVNSSSVDQNNNYKNEVVYQKTPEEKQQILINQRQCTKDASDYNITFWHSTDNSNMSGMKYSWDTPEFHYNTKLNTCLLYERYIQSDKYNSMISYQFDQIIDVYSNKTILTGYFIRDVSTTPSKEDVGYFGDSSNGVPNYTSNEFYRQKDILFSE